MLKKQNNWLVLNKIRTWIKKNKVLDVYVFGSFTRGKFKPRDIDLCILIRDSDEKNALNLISSLSKYTENINLKTHISLLTEKEFVMGSTLTKTLMEEGVSLLKGKQLSSIIGYKSRSMFMYSLKTFNKSQRVKFHYALKGRYGRIGVLKEVNGELIANGAIVVPINNEDVFKDFLDVWKVNYKIERILLS